MNEKARKVFDLLGVEPNEEFEISDGRYVLDSKFRFNDNLWLEKFMENAWIDKTELLPFLLNGKHEIIKLPQLTEADKNAVRYLRDGGARYVARDSAGLLWAYESKPTREQTGWKGTTQTKIFTHLFQFVQWTDEEPFCIEDLEV